MRVRLFVVVVVLVVSLVMFLCMVEGVLGMDWMMCVFVLSMFVNV